MRYYVTINGVSSLTIPGLAIRQLPSISKTLMRNQKETIDGRDGDIITELGYSAYDKVLEIGLFGTYDINQIIGFFNQKGTIVFSDEDDKYYNFTILDQIDYDKLVKFRTASVRIHCQPFKYPLTETPVLVQPESVSGEGTNITLDNTGEAVLGISLKGDTYQYSTTGKNLASLETSSTKTIAGLPFTIENGVFKVNGTASSNGGFYFDSFRTNSGTATFSFEITGYTKGGSSNGSVILQVSDDNTTFTNLSQQYFGSASASVQVTLDSTKYYRIRPYFASGNVFSNSTLKIQLEYGNTKTDFEPFTNGASPNPTYPQDIEVVTGGQEIKIQNKNLVNINIIGQVPSISNGNLTNYSGAGCTELIEVDNTKSYYFTYDMSTQKYVFFYDNNKNFLGYISNVNDGYDLKTNANFINTKYVRVRVDAVADVNWVQLEKGNQATTYTPHQEQNYEINLGDIELCKIGTYQDYIYKSGADWKIHREIGKVVLNENSTISDYQATLTNTYRFRYNESTLNSITASSNPFKCTHYNSNMVVYNFTNDIESFYLAGGIFFFKIKKATIDSQTGSTLLEKLASYLSTTNLNLYAPLITPTDETITDTELIEDLETLWTAYSYIDQTNITSSGSLPIYMRAVTLKKGTNEAVINNVGNIYAKPTIAIQGTGTIGLYLDNTQMLSIDMSAKHYITIDTEKMEAYNTNDPSELLNRKVTGDYSKIKLQPGNNTLKFTFETQMQSATITKWKRWL